ncbi:LuxR C-terminal-related transcriptional regulator [Streptomyces sp. NBC_01142]|uniref:LuxR C-terminal-related transcriptional regulator n=1 Tax=Streptomyces sp. NBC_01142 TaxID=2975865 RepID=UPI0022523AC9|nr:LuxR C-terminal-related transcriptional regulator [Streptomyces sp. NBC_01142]MCX4827118.1 LuxR C-terminal-related transcriptional regulator [Streptomyces sp. NBC_01142]
MAARRRGTASLPAEATRFIGRRRELSVARRMLARARLLTLTGPGGVGKTRLALRLAAQAQRSYPSGVWLVDLAAVETEQALTNTVLEVLGLNHGLGRLTPAELSERIHSKRILIVLDNCEHLLRPCALLARTLLEAAPELQIIATSRQALGVGGEHLLAVPPLTAPDPDDASCVGAAGHNEALDLFTDRAAYVSGEYVLTAEDRRVAARICHRLEGVPLAIELAVARLRVLNCEQILRRLDDRFTFLTGGNSVTLPRHQTLRATMDWSFDLCGPQEQLLWARLSVFCGGFDLEAVEAVCSGDGLFREEILDVLAGLTDKSVLIRDECPSQVRYSMLETLRQYGHQRLCESDELKILHRRHRDYYRALVLQAEAEWFTKQQADWCVRLRRERSNLRAAMKFCLDEPGESEVGLELAASLWSHRVGAGGLAEERQWLARNLASETAHSPARAKALWADGWLALLCGDIAAAQGRVTECRTLAQYLGDPQTNARAEHAGLAALFFQDDFPRAVPLLDAALAQYRDHGDAGDSWATLFLLSLACCLGGDPRAAALAQECLDQCEASGAQVCGETSARGPAVARALGQVSGRPAAPAAASKPVLTPRERQVALLLHQGLTDKEIAAQLVISPRTAQGHVQRILHKLGFTRRAQVVAWIQERTEHHPPTPTDESPGEGPFLVVREQVCAWTVKPVALSSKRGV